MVCEMWKERLDAYVDGALPAEEERAFNEHVRGCSACAAESLIRMQEKRALASMATRYVPDPAFRERIQQSLAGRTPAGRRWLWFPVLAGAMALVIAGVMLFILNGGLNRERRSDQQLLSELADLHVATLASTNPVDVVSTDRHTVKPWFAGKIPFTFNLPELQDSPFTLVGGKVSYLNQSPGAELIFKVRQHQISVFIFQQRAGEVPDRTHDVMSFNVRSWNHNGLNYFVVGDASGDDLDRLLNLMKAAA